MLSSLLRPKKGRKRVEQHSPYSSHYAPTAGQSSPLLARHSRLETRHATADFTETELDDEDTEDEDGEEDGEEEELDGDEDEREDPPLLPIFSSSHLDSIPVYNLTHAIRLVVLPKTETTLSWDQLRSPQVSQFLVKPMQQQIRSSHFSRATLYALMANCLQFQKEGQANPSNAGNSRTRAMVCELLAIKLLKEYNTRELIDALSYDFYPLQGISSPSTPGNLQRTIPKPVAARISTLEIAIRANAKRLLAHPVVVQQLEAIWAGNIVFHSAADNLHRPQAQRNYIQQKPAGNSQYLLAGQNIGYGTGRLPQSSPDKQPQEQIILTRRTVTLYDPRDASLFKLSRLRVPRYRQFFSTCSLAILLGLFVAVLAERSMNITPLEIVFWFWSAGFMLDEIVGFNEQGFSLYLMSFWNTFDVGILLLLMVYYTMRIVGIFLPESGRTDWNDMAYDVLAANAVLLFPRLFSVLDHYRYFSQLLVAFRLMAIDLVAVFVLILIACSGFFVAFTMSFGKNEYDAAEVAYRIFQILMGFTPAAWEAWPTYNLLGRALLVLFLFICHFLVVTILITVLTNSFMAIVSNANEEHQFVFAVNTISMVKNDALFSYIAPSNIFAWLLMPLRFFLPFRTFIKTNRTVIKATHFPLLFGIFAYEKLFLAREVFEPTDLIEMLGHGRNGNSFQEEHGRLFSPSVRMRQDSVAGYQKDRALDEVFRLTPRHDTIRNTRRNSDQAHYVVNNWIDQSGPASPPQEQDRSVVDRLEMRRQARKVTLLKPHGANRVFSTTKSVASDPVDLISIGAFHNDLHNVDHTDGDGDDELLTNDDDEGHRTGANPVSGSDKENDSGDEDYFHTPATFKPSSANLSSSLASLQNRFPGNTLAVPRASPPKRRTHNRNLSSNTILYNPVKDHSSSTSLSKTRPLTPPKHISANNTGTQTPASAHKSGHRTPRHSVYATARPILPNRGQLQTVPVLETANSQRTPQRQIRHRRSSLDMGMSELGFDMPGPGMVPSSFATQMALATGGLKGLGERGARAEDTDGMMGRLMLARMKTLEEGFAEVVKEFRGMRTAGNSSVDGDENISRQKGKERAGRRKREGGLVRTKSEIHIGTLGRGVAKGKENILNLEPDSPEGHSLERYLTKGSSL